MANDSTLAAVSVAALLALLACGGRKVSIGDAGAGSGSSSGAFPYSGPSCSAAQINPGCWRCTVDQCNGACVTSDCASFFQCYCACPAGDTSCQDQCSANESDACHSCLSQAQTCDSTTCKSECPVTTTACTGADCANGASSIETCTVTTNGTCTAAYYQVGSQQFPCASCTDTSACQMAAQKACQ